MSDNKDRRTEKAKRTLHGRVLVYPSDVHVAEWIALFEEGSDPRYGTGLYCRAIEISCEGGRDKPELTLRIPSTGFRIIGLEEAEGVMAGRASRPEIERNLRAVLCDCIAILRSGRPIHPGAPAYEIQISKQEVDQLAERAGIK